MANVFIYVNLDKTIFIRISPKYLQSGKILKLNKVLYGLHWSPLLWQQKLTHKMKKLSFKKIPQEPCIIQKNRIIGFF